jgi:UDP-glucose 4-epimerase
MSWLVTGGAGYIGAHVVRSLGRSGVDAVVVDDLSNGDASRVDVPFVHGDIADRALVLDTIARHGVTGVIHLAADKQVAESVANPLLYFRRNVSNLIALLETMALADVRQLVFSSSAAVYGMVADDVVAEDSACVPINPYGETKLIGEQIIAAQARTGRLSYAALRYFNVAGAGSSELGDRGVTNLIPAVFTALDRGDAPVIFGDDYPTPDGTCVRDFIHVEDLADAHVAAIPSLTRADAANVFNVGCGRGYSVREVVDEISTVTGQDIRPRLAPRRAGDPPSVVADVRRIADTLGWRAKYGLTEMVASAWNAHRDRLSERA